MLHYIFYTISIVLLLAVILNLNNYHLINNSLAFYLFTNLILNISFAIYYLYYKNYFYSFINILLLFIFVILLIKDLKKIIGYVPLRSIPYLLFTIYLIIKNLIIFF